MESNFSLFSLTKDEGREQTQRFLEEEEDEEMEVERSFRPRRLPFLGGDERGEGGNPEKH